MKIQINNFYSSSLTQKCPSLAKRGEGRFYKLLIEAFVLKIPLYPPFPKGELMSLFSNPKYSRHSCEGRNPDWIPHQVRNDTILKECILCH
jgi:hypothetical protein